MLGPGVSFVPTLDIPSAQSMRSSSDKTKDEDEEEDEDKSEEVGETEEVEDRNPVQDKRLSHGEIKELEEAGIDVHDLKKYSGGDLFKDREGNVYIKPKDGSGPGEPAGINIRHL